MRVISIKIINVSQNSGHYHYIMMTNKNPDKNALLLGMGFDNSDGQRRITKGDNFCLVGGSEETHDRMTETTIKFNEKLARKGKHLSELSRDEFRDMMREASE